MKKTILMVLVAIMTLMLTFSIHLERQQVYATGETIALGSSTTQPSVYEEYEYVSGVNLKFYFVSYSETTASLVASMSSSAELVDYYVFIKYASSGTNLDTQDIASSSGGSIYYEYSITNLSAGTDYEVGYYVDNDGDIYQNSYTFTTLSSGWTVTYDSNGGSAVSSAEVDDGELATEPTDPTRTHYTFDGWYTDDGVWADEWNFAVDTVTEDITLYAKWVLNEWTVYYDSNGGSAKSPDTYDYGETLIEPSDPTRSGYYFDGWFYDDSTFLNEVDWGTDTMPDNDVTVYADWSPKPLYTVSFDENGGTAVDDQSVYDDEYAEEPDPDPTRFMYTFDGWYTNEIYTTPWNFATMQITGHTTIYAKWVLQKVVTFDSNGGTAVDTQYIDDGELATEPPDPTRTGYDFDAWYEDDITFLDEWDFGSDTVTSDITLYANWTIHVWTVTWDSNDGTPIVPSNVEYDALITKPANPTRLGYGFVGWYSDEELTDEWRWNVDRMPDESITLYAKWQKNVDGVIDDFATDAGIGDTGKLLLSLAGMVVFAIIFVLVGLPALMTVIIMVIMFTVFLAIGWIPGWIAVIMMVLLFMMLLYSFKSSGGGEG